MTGNEYQQDALRTVSDRERDDLLTEGVLGLSGETGEVSDIVKKYKYQGHALNKKELARKELDNPPYIGIGYGYARHRAGRDEYGEKTVGWFFEMDEHPRSCPCWSFFAAKSAKKDGYKYVAKGE